MAICFVVSLVAAWNIFVASSGCIGLSASNDDEFIKTFRIKWIQFLSAGLAFFDMTISCPIPAPKVIDWFSVTRRFSVTALVSWTLAILLTACIELGMYFCFSCKSLNFSSSRAAISSKSSPSFSFWIWIKYYDKCNLYYLNNKIYNISNL